MLGDQLGSLRLLTDASGQATLQQSYDPFGNVLAGSGSTLTTYGYTGELRDASGLTYLRARYYNPTTGSFTSRDPFSGVLTQPGTLNAYTYALNNPLRYTDPSGKTPLLLIGALGGLLGGVAYGYGSQVIRNLNNGVCFWDALSLDISAQQVALYAGVGTLMGLGIGGGIQALSALTGIGTSLSADGDPTNEIQTGVNTVYQVVENGVTKYVGITNDFARRAGEHLRTRGWIIEPIQGLDKLSRTDARAVEQVLIEKYGLTNLFNKINSISSCNPIYDDAIQRGLDILKTVGGK